MEQSPIVNLIVLCPVRDFSHFMEIIVLYLVYMKHHFPLSWRILNQSMPVPSIS